VRWELAVTCKIVECLGCGSVGVFSEGVWGCESLVRRLRPRGETWRVFGQFLWCGNWLPYVCFVERVTPEQVAVYVS
jgi:hypothetical protein